MFVVFLGLSMLFWTLSKLSKEYKHMVDFKVNYTKLTKDKMLQKPPVERLSVLMNATGFSLFGYNLNTKTIDIDLSNVRQHNGRYYYLPNENIGNFQSQIKSEETIFQIYPDTLFFDFGKLISKKVKVISNIEFNYATGYNLISKTIVPDSITVTGPKKQINSITNIETKKIILNDISSNLTKMIGLNVPSKNDKVHFSDTEVVLTAKVEKFTEGELEVPFELINVPLDFKISTFSKKVKLTYRVSLKDFDKIHVRDFKVVCDYKKTQHDNLNYLIPTLLTKPNKVSNVKISPNILEFLYKK